MSYTKGPWVASDHHSGIGWRIETDAPGYHNDGWVIASEMLGPDAANNARLIAAAPELLEALTNLLAVVRGEGGTKPDAHGMAERAIAKATGAGA